MRALAVQVAVERRLAALDGVQAARLSGDELSLIAADQTAVGALAALQRARQAYRLHSYDFTANRVAPKAWYDGDDDDVFTSAGRMVPSGHQAKQPRSVSS